MSLSQTNDLMLPRSLGNVTYPKRDEHLIISPLFVTMSPLPQSWSMPRPQDLPYRMVTSPHELNVSWTLAWVVCSASIAAWPQDNLLPMGPHEVSECGKIVIDFICNYLSTLFDDDQCHVTDVTGLVSALRLGRL